MAVTAGRDSKRSDGDLITVKVEAGESIYSGSIVAFDADGYGVPAADTAGLVLAGIAADTVSNSGGADGDESVAVYTEGTFELAFSGTATQGTVGELVYMVDNNTVAVAGTTTNDILVGKVVEFLSSSLVRVKI